MTMEYTILDSSNSKDLQADARHSWSLQRLGSFLRTLLLVSRPGLWQFTIFLYALPAAADPKVLMTGNAIAGLLFVVFPLNLFVYAMNDLKDVDIDSKNDRKGGIFGAQASASDLQICVFIGVILLFATPLLLITSVSWCIAWSSATFIVNWLYNFGPTLSRVPVLDMICPLGYLLVIPFAAHAFRFQSQIGWWFSIYMALIVFRTQLWFQRFDSDADADAGKRTTAVYLGHAGAIMLLFSILACEVAAAGQWGCFAAQIFSVYSTIVLVLELVAVLAFDLVVAGMRTTKILMTASCILIVPGFSCLAAAWRPPDVT